MKVKNLVLCSILATVALVIFVVEACVPLPVAVPGLKLGLANVVTLAAMYIVGPKHTLGILLIRIILGNMFTGQMMSFAYSLSGGLLCYTTTLILKRFFNHKTMWFLGVTGAVSHTAGQMVCAYFMLRSASLFYYGAMLFFGAIISGCFTGLCAQYAVTHFKKLTRTGE